MNERNKKIDTPITIWGRAKTAGQPTSIPPGSEEILPDQKRLVS